MHRRTPFLVASLFVVSIAVWGMARAQDVCSNCVYVPLIQADGGITAIPTLTPTNTPSPTATPVPVTLLTNGDFEQGAVYWQPQSSADASIIANPAAPVVPHGGIYVARLYAAQQGFVAAIDAVNVFVPIDKHYLSYWVWIRSDEPACGVDLGGMGVSGSATAVDTFDLCVATQTNGWNNRTVNLTAYTGQTVTIEFLAGTLNGNKIPNSTLYIDDVGWRSAP